MTTDLERAVAACWQCIADAEVEHDAEHAARALAILAILLPEQRDAVG